VLHGDENIGPTFPDGDRPRMSVPNISSTLSMMIVPSCDLVSVRPTRYGASKPFWRITRVSRRGLRELFAGGYGPLVLRPNMRRLDQADGRSCSAALGPSKHTRQTRWRAQRAPNHNNEQWRARGSGSPRPPVSQRAFAVHRRNLRAEQFVVRGDLAHRQFQPDDFVVAVIPFAFFSRL
jgi:hypothetical protein